MISTKQFLIVSLTLMLSACSTNSSNIAPGGERAQRPEDAGFSTERLQKLTARMREGVTKGEYPGAVLIIGRQGKIAYQETFGVVFMMQSPAARLSYRFLLRQMVYQALVR